MLAAGAMRVFAQEEASVGTRDITGTGFSYQGRLEVDGIPYSGECPMEFALFDAASGGTQIGSTDSQVVLIQNGRFSTLLNANGEFGADAIQGEARFLETRAECFNSLVNLGRQEVTATPMALTLRPSAVVEGETDEPTLTLSNTGIDNPALLIRDGADDVFEVRNTGDIRQASGAFGVPKMAFRLQCGNTGSAILQFETTVAGFATPAISNSTLPGQCLVEIGPLVSNHFIVATPIGSNHSAAVSPAAGSTLVVTRTDGPGAGVNGQVHVVIY